MSLLFPTLLIAISTSLCHWVFFCFQLLPSPCVFHSKNSQGGYDHQVCHHCLCWAQLSHQDYFWHYRKMKEDLSA